MNKLMKLSLATAVAGHGVSAVAAVEDAGHLTFGAIEVTPHAYLKTGYNDNIYRKESGDLKNKSSVVYELGASAELKAQTGLNTYAVLLDATGKHFTSESNQNHTNYGAALDIHQEFTSSHRLDFNLGYAIGHDEGSTVSGVTDKDAPEFDKTTAGLVYGFGSTEAKMRFDFFGNYTEQAYAKTKGVKEGSDRETKEYGVTAYYRFMPKTDLLFEVKERQLDYTEATDNGYDITSYLVGLNWEATAKTTGFAKFGQRKRTAELAGVDSETFNGWEVGVSFMPVDRSVFQLSTARDYGLESENPQNDEFTKGTTTSLSWLYDATSKISTNVFVSLTDEDVERNGAVQKERDLREYGVSVDWKVMRNATMSLSYTNTDRDEKVKAVGAVKDDYSRNVYMLTAMLAI